MGEILIRHCIKEFIDSKGKWRVRRGSGRVKVHQPRDISRMEIQKAFDPPDFINFQGPQLRGC